ncbi:MAG: hypothetical protein EPO08_07040 [Rhodospirillaceae bacterium]|nr:MAG: hypothetical protein EPO08_07040 [Rhodospirillaceae bacterium]
MKAARLGAAFLVIVALAGCANLTRQQQRMLSGGAIGAAGGALLAGATGGGMLAGGIIGGAVGTAVGAATK